MRTFLALQALVLGALTIFWHPGFAQEKAAQPEHSALYRSFDPDKVRAKYAKAYEDSGKPHQGGARRNLIVTPPGDHFTDFNLGGEIPEKQVNEILARLKADLIELARKSKVVFVQEPSDTLSERPMVIFAYLFGSEWINLRTVRGSYFTYRAGKMEGAVEIIAVCTDPKNPNQSQISCTVHERQR